MHRANTRSNTLLAHTSDVVDGKISGYAYELQKSSELKPDVFISFHNNGGTKQHAIWAFVHEGDEYEKENKELGTRLTEAIAKVTNLTNKGVFGDSWPNRNDYYCAVTRKRAFYSLDEHNNKAKYRLLLEVGDMTQSRNFFLQKANLVKIGEAVKATLVQWLKEKRL